MVTQSDDGRRFNRGKLLNAGVHLRASRARHTHVIFHDCDLAPSRERFAFYHDPPPPGTLHHLAAGWDRYDSASFLGGIVSIGLADLIRLGGFSNDLWGWGSDDVIFRDRALSCGVRVRKDFPGGVADLEGLSLDAKLKHLKAHKLKVRARKHLVVSNISPFPHFPIPVSRSMGGARRVIASPRWPSDVLVSRSC